MLIKKPRIPIKEIALFGILPSSIKKTIYRFKGYKIGKNVSIGLGSVIIGDKVNIGDGTSIGFGTIIRGKEINIGRFVKIGSTTFIDTIKIEIDDDAKINEQVFIGGPESPGSSLKLGKRTIVMQMSFLNTTMPLEIGDESGIGGHCLLFTHGSWLSAIEGYPVTFAPIKLGKNVWLPWRVFIMPGVTIGDNVVIGANSLVSRNIPSNSLAAGSPAKIISENYPADINDSKRSEIIENIFSEFKVYLSFHEYLVTEVKESFGFMWEINKGNKVYVVIYQTEKGGFIDTNAEESIIITDYSEDIRNLFPKYRMAVDLRSKKRIGTSDIGEEIVYYFSRYGIRFDRLD